MTSPDARARLRETTPKADHTFEPASGTAGWCAVCYFPAGHASHRDGWEAAIERAIGTQRDERTTQVLALIQPLLDESAALRQMIERLLVAVVNYRSGACIEPCRHDHCDMVRRGPCAALDAMTARQLNQLLVAYLSEIAGEDAPRWIEWRKRFGWTRQKPVTTAEVETALWTVIKGTR